MYNIVAGADATWQEVEMPDEEIYKAPKTGREHKLLETLGLDWDDMTVLIELIDKAQDKIKQRVEAAEEDNEGHKKLKAH